MTTEEFAKLEAVAALVREAHEVLMSEMDRAGRRVGDAAAKLEYAKAEALSAGLAPVWGWSDAEPERARQRYIDQLSSMKFECKVTHVIGF